MSTVCLRRRLGCLQLHGTFRYVCGTSRTWLKCMHVSPHGMFPSIVLWLSPFNHRLPEHLATDGVFQIMYCSEKVFSICQHQQFFSVLSMELFFIVLYHHLCFLWEQPNLPNLLMIWVQPKEEAPCQPLLSKEPRQHCTVCRDCRVAEVFSPPNCTSEPPEPKERLDGA